MSRLQIIRLSMVRFATSFVVVLLVGVLNRIMIAELGITRSLVGLILSLLHLATPLALYFGFLSDQRRVRGYRRSPYIMLGMACCCVPMIFLPDVAGTLSDGSGTLSLVLLAAVLLLVIGFGITVSTIALHALVVDRCPNGQRGEAMTLIWMITLGGFIIASPVFSFLLPQYEPGRLRIIFIITAMAALALSFIGVWRQERPLKDSAADNEKNPPPRRFRHIFRALGANRDARSLFLFIALSDFFFFSQEYVLEAFGKEVFGLSVARTTSFNLYMGVGIVLGMIVVNSAYNIAGGIAVKVVIAIGCITASLSFSLLAWSTFSTIEAVILIAVYTLGFGKGIFNVGMARLMVRAARQDISGMIMGLWAVVGGLAIGFGELSGAALVDFTTTLTGSVPMGYGILFTFESAGLILCLVLIARFHIDRYRQHLDGRLPAAITPDWT